MSKFLKLIFWLIVILGIISYLLSYVMSDSYLKAAQRDDISVVATVVDVEHSFNADTSDDYFVIVSYTYEGETYQNNLGSLGKSWQDKIGQTMILRINPDNPKETLDHSRSTAIGMAMCGAFLFAAMFGLYSGVRGYTVPAKLESVLAKKIQDNMRKFVGGWVGLLIYAIAMAVYVICFGIKLGVLGVATCVIALVGAAMLIVLPDGRA